MPRTTTTIILLLLSIVVTTYCSKWIATPQGYQWSECLTKVESGSNIIDYLGEETIVISPNGKTTKYPPCKRPPHPFTSHNSSPTTSTSTSTSSSKYLETITEGWQSWASFNPTNNASFTTFLGYFTTPSAPPSWSKIDDAILYLFTGLQSDNWVPDYQPRPPSPPSDFDIIQPVIQYGGGSENGGGEYWGVASWYVTVDGTRSFWSDLIQLNPGDNVFGNMTQTGNTTWYIAGVTPDGKVTELTITKDRLVSQPWAYVTLEVYNIQSCDWFPVNSESNTVKFTQLSLTTADGPITPVWNTFNGKNACNTSIEVLNPTSINIIW